MHDRQVKEDIDSNYMTVVPAVTKCYRCGTTQKPVDGWFELDGWYHCRNCYEYQQKQKQQKTK